MANLIKIRRSSVPGKVPATGDLELGELAVNTNDGKLFLKKDDGTPSIIQIGAMGYTGSQGDQGIQGYTGSQGVIGYTGSQGDIGYTGSKGDQEIGRAHV